MHGGEELGAGDEREASIKLEDELGPALGIGPEAVAAEGCIKLILI